ncbi:MAG: tetratricopeptide repeat protein [Candidatus Brocadiaceae bacterium]|nr:tetratricopeptide repeat protein [Candidatus Brocadiaceae bacterium]
MSLLADLLSKLKYQKKEHGDVPVGLKRIVSDSQKRALLKKKLRAFSFFIAFVVISGFGAVYFMESYVKPVAVKKSVQQNINEIIPSGQTSDKTNIAVQTPPTSGDGKTFPPPVPLTEGEKGGGKRSGADAELSQTDIPLTPIPSNTLSEDINLKLETIPNSSIQHLNDDKDSLLYSARAYESKKDYYQALLNYKKALELGTQNYIIMNNISSVLIHMENFSDALRYLENALSIKRDYVPSLINLGITYIRLGNSVEGESYLLKALSIEPSNKNAIFNIAIFYERQGDNDEAYNYFYKLFEMGEIQGRLGTARIAEKQGNISLAVRVYKEILSMGGVDTQIKKLANERLSYLSPK